MTYSDLLRHVIIVFGVNVPLRHRLQDIISIGQQRRFTVAPGRGSPGRAGSLQPTEMPDRQHPAQAEWDSRRRNTFVVPAASQFFATGPSVAFQRFRLMLISPVKPPLASCRSGRPTLTLPEHIVPVRHAEPDPDTSPPALVAARTSPPAYPARPAPGTSSSCQWLRPGLRSVFSPNAADRSACGRVAWCRCIG